jgi:hypothetical protein
MGWETRSGKHYYYRKARVEGGRVRSIYFGCGDRAIAASLADGVVLPENLRKPKASDLTKPNIQDLTSDLKTLAFPSIPPLEKPSIEGLAKARADEAVRLEEKLSLLRRMIVS